jgi:hypothetical protein
MDLDGTALELVRRRMPVTVRSGKFVKADGNPTSLCVYARRCAGRSARAEPGTARVRHCPTIGLIVDGISIGDAGGYLEATRVSSLQSMELVSASDANLRYGRAADGAEVLVLWTRGRGPQARRL